MSSQPSLKTINRKTIWFLVVFDVLLLTLLLKDEIALWDLSSFTQKATISLLLTTAAGPLVAGFLNEFFSSHLKATLVFWHIKHALPGHRAFSELINGDPRTDVASLKQAVGNLPEQPVEQNQLWYRMYKKHAHDVTVINAHQNFLLYRDCASLTCLIGLSLLIASLALELPTDKLWGAFTLLTLQYGLFVIAAQNTGKRLVQNVLTLESIAKASY